MPSSRQTSATSRNPKRNCRGLLARLRNYFLTGVLVVAPIGITVWLIHGFVVYVDSRIVPLIPAPYNPEHILEHSLPGLGVIVLLIAITLIGALFTNFLGRSVIRWGEAVLGRVPMVRTIYGLLKQVLDAVLSQSSNAFKEVVLVEYPRKGLWVIGFIAARPVPAIRHTLGPASVCIYVPTAPNPTSGFLLFADEQELIRVEMPVEDAIKLVISCGIVGRADEAPMTGGAKAGSSRLA